MTARASPSDLRFAARSLRAALANPDIRSIEASWTLGVGADWAQLVIALLVAYEAGGPVAAGLVTLARMIPAALVNVLVDIGTLARPERALVGISLVRAISAVVMAAAALANLPIVLFVAVGAGAAVSALARPTTLAVLPTVATSPTELVSANTAGALGESLGTFAGPLVAGLVLAAWGAGPAAAIAGAVSLLAAVVVTGVRVADAARPPHHDRPRGVPIIGGTREMIARPPAAAVMLSFVAQTGVRGILTTFLAILAIDVLAMGQSGIGILGAALGLGGVLGALAALPIGHRRGLAGAFALALVAWGVPIVVIGIVPVPAVALIALGVVGVGNTLLDVSGFTLLQRGTSNRARAAVFAVLEVTTAISASIGGLLAGGLVTGLGVQGALVATGLILPVVALLGWRWVRRLDHEGVVPEAQAALLRGIPLFATLPLSAVERVASGMCPVAFAPGQHLTVEGEPGEGYLVIVTGSAVVTVRDEEIGRLGPGDGLGEIALLHEVARTATVTAVSQVDAYEIDRATFLAAVTGHDPSAAAAAAIVEARLAGGSAAVAVAAREKAGR